MVHFHEQNEPCTQSCMPRDQWLAMNRSLQHSSQTRRRVLGVLKYIGFVLAVAVVSAAFMLAALMLGNSR